jgi:recombinase
VFVNRGPRLFTRKQLLKMDAPQAGKTPCFSRKYLGLDELTPAVLNGTVRAVNVHAPDKSKGLSGAADRHSL